MTFWTENRIVAYRLVRAWECGSRTLHRIFSTSPDLRTFINNPQMTGVNLTDVQRRALSVSIKTSVEPDIELMEREGIDFILPSDPAYPAMLSSIPDPPAALFLRGAALRDEIRVALVGTRDMTPYGRRCSEFFSGELAMRGGAVTSGLALGTDAACHRGCLDVSGRTIAVLPSGVNDRSISPQTNAALAARIIAEGGTLVSENAPGTPTLPYQFLHRNRLIAGLSDAVVIIEADHGSGALVTARLALEQGREVLAVPGSIWSRASRGTNALIRDGAKPCTTVEDIWSAINLHGGDGMRSVSETRSRIPQTPEEQALLAELGTPKSADELTRSSGRSPADVCAILSVLEMKGRIISVGPKTYMKAAGC
jgi:DNA processing protein